jgi:tRNA1Val (adenine37-N6)-methyltransferase
VDLICGLRQAGLEPKRLRPVLARPGARVGQVLVEAVKGAGPGLGFDAPLIVREAAGGDYRPEVAAMLRPPEPLRPSEG